VAKRLPYRGMCGAAFANLVSLPAPRIDAMWLTGIDPSQQHVRASCIPVWSDGGAAFEAEVGRPFDPYLDLDFEWDFGETGQWVGTDPETGGAVDFAIDQQGFEAAYVYQSPGTYTIRCRAYAERPDGSIVEGAESTTLRYCEVHAVEFRATGGTTFKPTGGTYRLGFDLGAGLQWTGEIAWNAAPFLEPMDNPKGTGTDLDPYNGIQYALEQRFGAGRFRVSGTAWVYRCPVTITLEGDLGGQSFPVVQVDTSKLTGTGTISAPCRKVWGQAGSTAASFVVSAFSGGTKHWDPSAPTDGDGTIGNPHNGTGTKPLAWLFAAPATNKRALIKRGTTWANWSETSKAPQTSSNLQLMDYGSGAEPIIQHTAASVFWGLNSTVNLDTPLDIDRRLVLRGVDVRAGEATQYITHHNDFVGSKAANHFVIQSRGHLVWNVKSTGANGSYEHEFPMTQGGHGILFGRIRGVKNVAANGSIGIAIHGSFNRWFALLEGVFRETGPGPANSRIHHIYNETLSDVLFDCVSSEQMGNRNFMLNGDCVQVEDSGGFARHYLVRRMSINNCHSGVELSNDDNGRRDDPKSPFYGKFSATVIQDLTGKSDLSAITPVTHGDGLVFRYCRLGSHPFGAIALGGQVSGRVEAYRNKTYENVANSRTYNVRCDRGYLAENVAMAEVKFSTGGFLNFEAGRTIATWKLPRNQWWVPSLYAHAGGTYLAWNPGTGTIGYPAFSALTQAPGQSFADPGWANPSAGDFSTGTPPPITYTLTGPTTGSPGVAGTYTVQPSRPSAEALTTAVGGSGGSATPSTLTYTGEATAKTFQATPAGAGTMTVQVLRSGVVVASLNVTVGSGSPPPVITYTASASPSNVAVGATSTITFTPSSASTETLDVVAVGPGTLGASSLTFAGTGARTVVATTTAAGAVGVRLQRAGVVIATATVTAEAPGGLDPRTRSRRAKRRIFRRLR
jgi:hypothetical protein